MGYQIIEPVELDNILAQPKNVAIAVALLEWLADAVRHELRDQLTGVELEVITVEYMGAYPALGLRYVDPREDRGQLVLESITRVLAKARVMSFIEFVERRSEPPR